MLVTSTMLFSNKPLTLTCPNSAEQLLASRLVEVTRVGDENENLRPEPGGACGVPFHALGFAMCSC